MSKNPKLYTSEKTGETKSLKEWGNSAGIDPSTLFYRVNNMGMSIDEAITVEFNKRQSRVFITDPITGDTHSISEWAEITGIPFNTIYNRIFVHKWPIEKALRAEKHEVVNKNPRPKDTYSHMDLTGRRFGKLTVLHRADEDEDYTYEDKYGRIHRTCKWVCKCDCGNIAKVVQKNLISKGTTSCGCNRSIEMIGRKFGKLTVIERAPDKVSGDKKTIYWYCKCDCGNPNLTIASGNNLRSGNVTSCGCKVGRPANTWAYNSIIYGDCNTQTVQYPVNYLPPAIMYKDSNGRSYTPEEWEASFPDQFE